MTSGDFGAAALSFRRTASFVVRRSSFVVQVRGSSFDVHRSSFAVRRASFVVRRSFRERERGTSNYARRTRTSNGAVQVLFVV